MVGGRRSDPTVFGRGSYPPPTPPQKLEKPKKIAVQKYSIFLKFFNFSSGAFGTQKIFFACGGLKAPGGGGPLPHPLSYMLDGKGWKMLGKVQKLMKSGAGANYWSMSQS